jgi:hypothetical protein
MDAVLRLARWVRLRPAAVCWWAAVGCTSPQTLYPGPLGGVESVPEQRAKSEAAYWADQRAKVRSQAPGDPLPPAGPVAPPKVDPAVVPWTPAAPAPVVPAGGPTPEQGTPQVRVAAVVGSDVVITDDEVWQMVRQRAGEYVKLVGTERDAREKELFREELRRLIERELILHDFLTKVKKNKPQALEELKEEASRTAAKQMKEFKRVNKFPSEEAFTEALKAQGMSVKGLQRQLERNAMMNMYLGQVMKDKGVKGVSLAVIQRYYDEHPDEFKVEDRVKWMDLFVSYRRFATTVEARQYAEGVHKQAQDGADFAELVKQFGHGDSALRGGEGIGQKPGEISPPELEPTLLKMTAGQLSGIIPTETGFHIVKVVEREVAGVRPFDEKTQIQIRNRLAALAQKAEYEKLIEELWRKTTVRVIELP